MVSIEFPLTTVLCPTKCKIRNTKYRHRLCMRSYLKYFCSTVFLCPTRFFLTVLLCFNFFIAHLAPPKTTCQDAGNGNPLKEVVLLCQYPSDFLSSDILSLLQFLQESLNSLCPHLQHIFLQYPFIGFLQEINKRNCHLCCIKNLFFNRTN